MKSIIQDQKECFICGINYDIETITRLHEHHIFEGTARRKLSEKYGLKVYLCHRHHVTDTKYSIHSQKQLDLELKQLAQRNLKKLIHVKNLQKTLLKVTYSKKKVMNFIHSLLYCFYLS